MNARRPSFDTDRREFLALTAASLFGWSAEGAVAQTTLPDAPAQQRMRELIASA